jgi:mono/diheme cytochrome c family protein
MIALALVAGACRQDMHDQPKYKPLAASAFFADGKAARPPVQGTVARGHLHAEDAFYTGRVRGEPVAAFPLPVSRQLIERGRERYTVFCSPCHGALGDGQGMVVRRGFRQPPSFHVDRLRQAPPGHYFDVITNGFGAMASYASRVPPEDRWAIIAYVRALQLSQRAGLEDVPPEKRKELESAP